VNTWDAETLYDEKFPFLQTVLCSRVLFVLCTVTQGTALVNKISELRLFFAFRLPSLIQKE